MDTAKFIEIIKQFPQVWDRNCGMFREPSLKIDAWQSIGGLMGCPANLAKENFKGLREKYVREKEKQAMFGEKYIPWEFLEKMSFLNPHIISRKQNFPYQEQDKVEGNHSYPVFEHYGEFDRALIGLVKKAHPIWDRRSNGYPSKQVKFQLWKGIAQEMNKDVNTCMLRWKGLREKYIRQKNKFDEGDGKWEFLDDMNFLDSVIQYRRKNHEPFQNYQPNFPEQNFNFNSDSSIHDSSSNEWSSPVAYIKNEDCSDLQDSSDSGTATVNRKRSASESSSSYEKREKLEESSKTKSPESMFADLVASMLAKKTEREKNIAMIEIMQILTK